MKAIIAEKPSVALEIAKITGANEKKDGYVQGNGYMVTWAFGHLVGLAMPEEYGYKSFQRESLPMLPPEFILTPKQTKVGKSYGFDKGALKQLKTIDLVFSKCSSIIVATDAGREGELIFRYIYNYLGCKKPFSRLWISSLTDKAIREGLKNLRSGHRFDKLYAAAKARSESDWLVGINATQAITLCAGNGLYSLGRVQTPTLAMVCSRYLEHINSLSNPYWAIEAGLEKDRTRFIASVPGQFEEKAKAETVCQSIKEAGTLTVKSTEGRQRTEKPPLLYDLTTLQKEANSKLGFSADKTLSIAQKLYEAKLSTYPRTGSRYIPDDILGEIPPLLKILHKHPTLGIYAKTLNKLNKQCVNNGKITDHHAIIITENQSQGLGKDEQLIYDMIAGRMLEAFSPNCIKEVTSVVFDAGGTELKARGANIKEKGWRAVQNPKEKGQAILPSLSEGERLSVHKVSFVEKQTQPKALLTEASLLSAMENSGRELENEEYRKSMGDVGIGTPATRAAIIETLFSRGYMNRQKKSLVPTEKGLAVYDIVKDMKIANVEMTGAWEHDLSRIEQGSTDAGSFLRAISQYASQITEELLSCRIEAGDSKSTACPKCSKGKVTLYPRVAKCSNKGCGLMVFREVCGKTLSESQVVQLLTKGGTPEIKGLKSKKGKTFSAFIVFDKEYKTSFEFPQKKRFVKSRGSF